LRRLILQKAGIPCGTGVVWIYLISSTHRSTIAGSMGILPVPAPVESLCSRFFKWFAFILNK
jgi:hypothetical protein